MNDSADRHAICIRARRCSSSCAMALIRCVLPRPTPPCRKTGLKRLPGAALTACAAWNSDLVGRADDEGLERVVRRPAARSSARARDAAAAPSTAAPAPSAAERRSAAASARDDYANGARRAGELGHRVADRRQEVPRDPRLEEATRNFETDFSIRAVIANGLDPGREVPVSHVLPQQWQRRRPECLHARPPLVQTVAPYARRASRWLSTPGENSLTHRHRTTSPRAPQPHAQPARDAVVLPPLRGRQTRAPDEHHPRRKNVETKPERRLFYARVRDGCQENSDTMRALRSV